MVPSGVTWVLSHPAALRALPLGGESTVRVADDGDAATRASPTPTKRTKSLRTFGAVPFEPGGRDGRDPTRTVQGHSWPAFHDGADGVRSEAGVPARRAPLVL